MVQRFHGSLSVRGGPPSPVEIEVGARGVACHGGERSALRYDEVVVDVNDVDGSLVVRAPERDVAIVCGEAGFAEALVRGLGDRAEPHLVTLVRGRGRRRRATRWFFIFGGVAAFLVLGIVLLPSLAVSMVDFLPASVDARIGEAAHEELAMIGPRIDDPTVGETMRILASHLVPHADAGGFDVRIEVRESSIVNAMALPGGRIVVTTGLLELAPGPDEVAAVLAHEIAHVTLRHGLRAFMRGAGLIVVVTLLAGDDASVAGVVAGGAAMMVFLSHSRETELAADAEGLAILGRAGLDARSLSRMLALMQGVRGDARVDLPEWARTHPETEARIAAIESVAGEDASISGIDVDWARFEAAMARRRLGLPHDP